MKRKPDHPGTFTVSKFAAITGIDRHELQRRLESAGAVPTAATARGAGEYKLRELVVAFAGGDERAERLRKTRAEAERIEIQNARSHGELINVAEVKKLGAGVMVVVRNKILASSLTRDEQDALLLEILNLRDMDWSRAAD